MGSSIGSPDGQRWVQCTTGCHQSSHCLSSEFTTVCRASLRCTRTKPSGSPCTWLARKRRIGGFSLRKAGRDKRIKTRKRAAYICARSASCCLPCKTCIQWHPRKGRRMPSSRPYRHLVHRPRNQERPVSGHALGARYTSFSMIPSNGVYRVRRRRFAEAQSDSTI